MRGGIKAAVFGRQGHYLVEIGKERFFVKREDNLPSFIDNEFNSTKKARELLKDLPWIEIIDEQLGYKKDNILIFVSKWDDRLDERKRIHLDSYLKLIKENPNKIEEREEIFDKIKMIQFRLSGFIDVNSQNMYYDTETKKIILFDLKEAK
jgi:hypothetical protein